MVDIGLPAVNRQLITTDKHHNERIPSSNHSSLCSSSTSVSECVFSEYKSLASLGVIGPEPSAATKHPSGRSNLCALASADKIWNDNCGERMFYVAARREH